MKRVCYLILISITIWGCNEIEPMQMQEEDIRVQLRPLGEITALYEPFTKTSTNDLYLVQIWRGSSPFAFGAFDDLDNLCFNLKKGTDKYRIIVSLLKDKAVLGNLGIVYEGTYLLNPRSYGCCFCPSDFPNPYNWYPLNIIYYNGNSSMPMYYGSSSISGNGYYSKSNGRLESIEYAYISNKYVQCNDWFYGEITDYSPNGDFETLTVDLKRVGFNLKYELSGVTDGEVSVKIYNSDKVFFQETVSSSTYESVTNFYAFYEARNAWLYADDYSENITVAVSWKRGIGITQDLGSTTVQVKRNCLNNIKIKLGSDDQSAGVSLSAEPENSIGAEAITIPVQ